MTHDNARESQTIWQTVTNDGLDLPGEPAIVVESYRDCIAIHQVERSVLINYETIPELIKLLKKLKPIT